MRTFLKAQVSSLTSTLVDFTVTILLTEGFGWWYLVSTTIGTVSGGVTNFAFGLKWVFCSGAHSLKLQVRRFCLVWIGSILLNISLVYVFTSLFGLNYLISKTFVAVFVGVFFNYFLQKRYVFGFQHGGKQH